MFRVNLRSSYRDALGPDEINTRFIHPRRASISRSTPISESDTNAGTISSFGRIEASLSIIDAGF